MIRGKELTVGASIGIAVNGPDTDSDELLRDADVAMYTVKSSGRGRFEVFRTGCTTRSCSGWPWPPTWRAP